MGFRYRKSINLGGGSRITFSKSGIGYSWGRKGFRFTKTANGRKRTTVSLPGTGLSYVTETSGKKKRKQSKPEKSEPASGEPITLGGIIGIVVLCVIGIILIEFLIAFGLKVFLITFLALAVALGIFLFILERKA